jgi:hypothetical protein
LLVSLSIRAVGVRSLPGGCTGAEHDPERFWLVLGYERRSVTLEADVSFFCAPAARRGIVGS